MLRKAAVFIIEELCGKRLNLILNIKFKEMPSNLRGSAIYEDYESRYPREFSVHVSNSLSLKSQLETLAHELTHVKQFARNELVDFDNSTTRYKRRVYSSDTPYKKQPWEIEAMANEHKLANKFLKETGIKLNEYEILRTKK